MSQSHESNPTDVFQDLLNEKFAVGVPHRHAPGTRSGEEEVLLNPPDWVEEFMPGPAPEMIRAIRPNLNDHMPVRERHPREIVGHRLELRQVLDVARTSVRSAVYYVHRQGEIDAGRPPLLRAQHTIHTPPPPIRQPYGQEHLYLGFIPLPSEENKSEDGPMEPEAISQLFRFIGGCTVQELQGPTTRG